MARRSSRATKARGSSMHRAAGGAGVGSLRSWIESFYEPHGELSQCPPWPPDLFAVVGSILRRTGAYRIVFDVPRPGRANRALQRRLEALWISADECGRSWRDSINAKLRASAGAVLDLTEAIPPEIEAWWTTFCLELDEEVADFAAVGAHGARAAAGTEAASNALEAAIALTIAADAACAGVGVSRMATPASPEDAPDLFLYATRKILEGHRNQFQSLCLRVSPARLSVLPKQHTPQSGLTFRSLTHHLALCPVGEVRARWYGPFEASDPTEPRLFNVLLLPWPLDVDARDFKLEPAHAGRPVSHFGTFSYAPQKRMTQAALLAWVRRALAAAEERGGVANAIVFPEAALSLTEYAAMERLAAERGCLLVAGVRVEARESTERAPVNACVVQTKGLLQRGRYDWKRLSETRFVQGKHHRWRLDRNQILQYDLGSRLPASGRLWENIALPDRGINFICLGSWMTWCALICEDLARQEPAAEVVRAIAPNLLIALLMDGPQLKDRWSARYASGLADDPGTSVLAVSNLGMVKRSRPVGGDPVNSSRGHVVALWRDAIGGSRELSIDPDHTACLLSLVCHTEEEYSADGRRDGFQAHHPIYAGHRSLDVPL